MVTFRRGRGPRIALALAALAATAAPAQEPRSIPAFPTQAEAITADVVVLDKDGRPVRGLTKEDFTLLEDGRPQRIVGFQAREAAPSGPELPREVGASDVRGRTFAFLLDDLGTQVLPMEEVKKTIATWLNDKADPRDEVTLATTSGDAWWPDRVGRGRPDLLAVLSRVQGKRPRQPVSEWMSDWEAYQIAAYENASAAAAAAGSDNPDLLSPTLARVLTRWQIPTRNATLVRARALEQYDSLTRRIQSVLNAVERLSQGLAGARGRKSILIFSEGFLNDSHQSLDRAIDASQRGNTAVYFIDAKGLAGQFLYDVDHAKTPPPGEIGAIGMEEGSLETAGTESLAENTGGSSIRNTNDLLGGLERVADESSVYYLLGYQPEKSPDGKWHKLAVKVARPGMTVRTRRGYQATPRGALDPSRKEAKRPLDPAVMTSGADDTIALRVAPYVLEADKTGLARVLVALEVSTSTIPFSGAGDRQQASLDLTILGLSRDQARLFPIDERLKLDLRGKATGGWLTLLREIRLPAGVAQVRVLVRDQATNRVGTVAQRIVVPALDGPYLATPILTDRIETPRGGSPRLVPAAHRRFRPEGRLYCAYEVFGMKDPEGRVTSPVAGGYTLLSAGGRVVRAAPPTPIAVDPGGRLVRMLSLSLDGLEEGEYELILEVLDPASGRTLVTHEGFVLDRSASMGTPAGAGSASDAVDAGYRELVMRYARGERALALAGLPRFSEGELSRIARAVQAAAVADERGQAAEPPLPLRAAVMLHADLDEAERSEATGTEQPRRCPGKQAEIAARYAGLLAGNEDTRGFARRFFLALASRCQWDACLQDAQRWAREGLKLFPRDAELLLAAGSALEESATIWGGGSTVAVSPRYREAARAAAAQRAAQYNEARAYFEDAVAADDSLTLARVRLGRVRWHLGQHEAARAVLEEALARSSDPHVLYLAHLFLGQVHEDRARLEQAVEHYRLSLALDPKAQAAAVALAHALGRSGQVQEAREVIRRSLAQAGRRPGRDAYWDYLVGEAVHFQELLAALRQESLQ